MSDNNDNDSERTEFEDWLDLYYNWFAPDLIDGFEPKQEIYNFYYGPYLKIMQDLAPEVRKLMYKQYPEMELEMRPAVIQQIDRIVSRTGRDFLIHLFNLLYDVSKGVDLRAKYPDFDKWVELFARPRDPYRNSEKIFANMPWLTEEQKKEIIESGEKEDFLGINRKEKRKKEFIDMFQTIVLKHYRLLENLSSDGWIVYSAFLSEEAFEYKYHSDFIGTFIALGLPEEDILLNYSELQKKFDKIYEEKLKIGNETLEKGGEGE